MRLRTVDIGVPLRFADYGGEGSPIVLLHGLGGNHLNWMRFAPELTRHGRVLVPDLPGFGGTPPLPQGTSISTLRRSVVRFLDHAAPGPVTLIGNSLGGVLSMMAATELSRVRRLVLVSPAVPHAYFEPIDLHAFLTMGAALVPGFGPATVQTKPERVGADRYVRDFMTLVAHEPRRVPEDVIAAHAELARGRSNQPWMGTAFSEALRSLSWLLLNRLHFFSIVRSVSVPTLVLAGERDRLVAARSIREACEYNRSFELRSWSDVGHVAQLETPERVLAEVSSFFACHPAAPVEPHIAA